MGPHSRQASCSHLLGRTMLSPVTRRREHTVQGLSSLTGIGWTQVFLSVKRFNRIGRVSLIPVRPCGYRISIAGLLRR